MYEKYDSYNPAELHSQDIMKYEELSLSELMGKEVVESSRERLRQLEKKSLSIEEKMAEIRLVNKAKWFLISELSMSEPEAHRYIENRLF